MNIEIILNNEALLLEEDASLSYGWLKIIDRALNVSFFEDKQCMIFIAVTLLGEHLVYLQKNDRSKVRWIGEGYGAEFGLERHKESIIISTNKATLSFNYNDFKSAYSRSVLNFTKKCLSINPAIRRESAFVDLISIINDVALD